MMFYLNNNQTNRNAKSISEPGLHKWPTTSIAWFLLRPDEGLKVVYFHNLEEKNA